MEHTGINTYSEFKLHINDKDRFLEKYQSLNQSLNWKRKKSNKIGKEKFPLCREILLKLSVQTHFFGKDFTHVLLF